MQPSGTDNTSEKGNGMRLWARMLQISVNHGRRKWSEYSNRDIHPTEVWRVEVGKAGGGLDILWGRQLLFYWVLGRRVYY
jgi:hypothetical protein